MEPIYGALHEKLKKIEIIEGFYYDIIFKGKDHKLEEAKLLNKKLKIWEKRNRRIYVDLKKNFSGWHNPKEIKLEEIEMLRSNIHF